MHTECYAQVLELKPRASARKLKLISGCAHAIVAELLTRHPAGDRVHQETKQSSSEMATRKQRDT